MALEPKPAFDRAMRLLGPGSVRVADVGARWGATERWFRQKGLATLVGFEPDPLECAALNERADPDERFYPVALGSQNGTTTLYVTKAPACSSLYPPSPEALARFSSLPPIMELVRTTTVPLRTMATWAAENGVDRLDFMKIDTQGSELDILVGAGNLLDNCLGLEVEVEFFPLYYGQPLFADVDNYLRSRGFLLWRLNDLTHYSKAPTRRVLNRTNTAHYDPVTVQHASGDGRLVWANAVYFRDPVAQSDQRSRAVLAALLEALGDLDGTRQLLGSA